VVLNASSDSVEIDAVIDGKRYRVVQKLQVPLVSNSSLTLNSTSESFWIVATYNGTVGRVDVKVQTSP